MSNRQQPRNICEFDDSPREQAFSSNFSAAGPITASEDCALKVRDVIVKLRSEGWQLVRWKGSHRQWRHLATGRLVTLVGRDNDDPRPIFWTICKQAGWKKRIC